MRGKEIEEFDFDGGRKGDAFKKLRKEIDVSDKDQVVNGACIGDH